MKLTKLNADSSWLIEAGDVRVLLDPWLKGPQTDFAPWFSRQWHTSECTLMEQLPPIDMVLVSHPFTDHCHKETMLLLPKETPVVASQAVAKVINSWKYFERVEILTPHKPFRLEGFSITHFPSRRFLDLVHDGLLIEHIDGNIFYAPHGYRISEKDKFPPVKLLIATNLTYHLPFFLGGDVNLGYKNAQLLVDSLLPEKITFTHNERKRAEGLVSKLSVSHEDGSLIGFEASVFPAQVSMLI